MNVRLLTDRVGTTSYHAEGEVIDLPDGEAWTLIRAGQAELAEAAPAVEAAVLPGDGIERAVLPRPQIRKGNKQ